MPQKILIVDDEKHLLRLVEMSLELEGFEVVTAADGQQALECIDQENPDLVIMDIIMPQMDGLETLKRIRENEATTSLPVVILTARAQDADLEMAQERGATRYVTKPFDPRVLAALVRDVLETEAKR